MRWVLPACCWLAAARGACPVGGLAWTVGLARRAFRQVGGPPARPPARAPQQGDDGEDLRPQPRIHLKSEADTAFLTSLLNDAEFAARGAAPPLEGGSQPRLWAVMQAVRGRVAEMPPARCAQLAKYVLQKVGRPARAPLACADARRARRVPRRPERLLAPSSWSRRSAAGRRGAG